MKLNADEVKELHELVDSIQAALMTMPIVRPVRKNMVMGLRDMYEGQRLIMHHPKHSREILITRIYPLGVPKRNRPFFEYTDGKIKSHASFADFCIIPYKNCGINGEDVWNDTNWLEMIEVVDVSIV